MIRNLALLFLMVSLSGCSYARTAVTQANYSMRQLILPEQRTSKHMLERETYFVFGKIGTTEETNPDAVAVIALSDRYREGEVVDVNHLGRTGSYYGLNLPAGAYRLLVVTDLDRNGFYEAREVIGSREVSLSEAATPDMVQGGCDIDLDTSLEPVNSSFRVAVHRSAGRTESLFFPKGTIRSLDDPIFSPQMATLGMYEPAAFLEAAPMMFYALEEDCGYKVPVVFVHGIGGSARDFADMVAALDRRRYRPWFFHYPSGADLTQLSEMFYKIFLSGRVIQLGDMPMVIVAHSMGGLVVRDALNRYLGDGENQVQRLITIASPMGGHPGARMVEKAPRGLPVLPSWRDVNPDSSFIARLHRKPLPEGVAYHLLFTYGDSRSIRVGANSDGVVPLSSQLSPLAQKEAIAQQGFNDSHTGILHNPAAIQEVVRIAAEAHAPYPEAHLRELQKGGFSVPLGPKYTPLDAYIIRSLGYYLEALTTGTIVPISPAEEQFIRAAHGKATPETDVENAWVRFIHDYPDRQALTVVPENAEAAR